MGGDGRVQCVKMDDNATARELCADEFGLASYKCECPRGYVGDPLEGCVELVGGRDCKEFLGLDGEVGEALAKSSPFVTIGALVVLAIVTVALIVVCVAYRRTKAKLLATEAAVTRTSKAPKRQPLGAVDAFITPDMMDDQRRIHILEREVHMLRDELIAQQARHGGDH